MKFTIVLNPYANRWRAQKHVPAIREAFDAAGLDYDFSITTRPNEATEVARSAANNGYDAVIAAGGDGTVNEVLNGLAQAAGDGPTLPMGVIPIGNGNDFSDMVGNPRSVAEIAAIYAKAKTRQIDLGQVNDHFFDNNCAVAMEPLITIESAKLKRITGNLRYLLGTLIGLSKLKAWDMQVEWDGGNYSGKTLLLSICNGPRTGKTFMMAPDAEFDDGLFDVILVREIPFKTILTLLPKLIRGTHIGHPDVTHFQSSWVNVNSQPSTPIHADGEVLESATKLEYKLLPKKLTLLSA